MAAGSSGAASRPPRAILFDWDNTLVDAWKSIHAALNATLVAEGLPPWSLEETRARVRGSLRDTFPAMFGARWEEARDIFYTTLEAVHLDTVEPLPGAETLLRELAGGTAFLGVVSNKTGTYLRREAAHLGWAPLFRRLVGAADAAEDKPAAAPVHMALENAPVGAGPAVWFVGDTATDMLCARNARCVAILVRDVPPGRGDGVDEALFADLVPDLHVNDLDDLAEILTKLV